MLLESASAGSRRRASQVTARPLTPVTECVRAKLDLGGHVGELDCFVTDPRGYDMVLGLDWFESIIRRLTSSLALSILEHIVLEAVHRQTTLKSGVISRRTTTMS